MIEIYKKNLLQYKCNIKQQIMHAIADGYFIIWDSERIKKCFNFGNGTEQDFKQYMEANKDNCIFINNL